MAFLVIARSLATKQPFGITSFRHCEELSDEATPPIAPKRFERRSPQQSCDVRYASDRLCGDSCEMFGWVSNKIK